MMPSTRTLEVQSPQNGYELPAYLSDIGSVLDHIGQKPSVLLGYSHSAFFTTHFALAHPDRVAALILLEPALFNERGELMRRARLAINGDEQASLHEMLKHIQPDVAQDDRLAQVATRLILKSINDPRAVALELLVRANNPISTEQLGTLKMPVLLIGGSNSNAAYTVHRAAVALPSAYVWWIQGATHGDLMGEKYSDQIGRAVNTFITAVGLDVN